MFSVIFEVNPHGARWDDYLGIARMLRPELEAIDGFVDNIRYRSMTREGWLLSLSGWRDEKAVVRWRTRARHHQAQARGRDEILADYHLRVGEVTHDTHLPAGQALREQRRDETVVGAATTATLIAATRPGSSEGAAGGDAVAASVAAWLGLRGDAAGLVAWDVFEAVLTPGDMILLLSWRDQAAAAEYERATPCRESARRRRVRVVRDYGMFDRREAPQFHPDVPGRPTLHD